MANYPDSIYEPREKENRSGVEYIPEKKTVSFVEDVKFLDDEVVAIETELGTNPKGVWASVKENLEKIWEAIAGFVASFLDLSDTPASYEGQAGKAVIVNEAEDGLEFGEANGAVVTPRVSVFTSFAGTQADFAVRHNFKATGSGVNKIDTLGLKNETGVTSGSLARFIWDVFPSIIPFNFFDKNPTMNIFIRMVAEGGDYVSHWLLTTDFSDFPGVNKKYAGIKYFRVGGVKTAYVVSCDGVAEEATEITGLITTTTWTHFKIAVIAGESVKFYKGDTLLATHTVRVPSGANDSYYLVNIGITNQSAANSSKATSFIALSFNEPGA